MFYSRYDKKINTLRFSYNQNKELIKKLDTLKSELKLKEQYFINSGFLDASKLSYYADRIAYTVPKEIVLTQLNINPLEGKIKNNKPISFQNRKILILGTVTQSIILNNWVKQLKDTDWIKNVKIIHYNQESVEIPAEFELQIDL